MALTISPQDRRLFEEWADVDNTYFDKDPELMDDNKDNLGDRITATLARMSKAILEEDNDNQKEE